MQCKINLLLKVMFILLLLFPFLLLWLSDLYGGGYAECGVVKKL